jgi:hypothetical protein
LVLVQIHETVSGGWTSCGPPGQEPEPDEATGRGIGDQPMAVALGDGRLEPGCPMFKGKSIAPGIPSAGPRGYSVRPARQP